jgi:hypothetical protein
MRGLDAASAASRSLARAVAATLTPASASRRAISPQIAPDAPVIHATFQGYCCSTHSPSAFVMPAKAGIQ